MLAASLQSAPLMISPFNSILLLLAAVTAIVSYLRRKQEIGGWLMYFYYWMSALLVVYLKDALGNYKVFLPSSKLDSAKHLALIIAVYPRLFALLAVVGAAFMVLLRREWVWIERLRMMLGVTILIACISVGIDVRYFPTSVRFNLVRAVGLCLWFLYFCNSKRVRGVFRTKDWNAVAMQRAMT